MEILITIAGLACLSWSVAEFARASSRRDPLCQFGVVDADRGTVVDVVVDRRSGRPDRRPAPRIERRVERRITQL